jgi:protein-tyrosine phosphatase
MTIGVLFVCTGNICRSPMAEGVFRSMVQRAGFGALFTVDSAGTFEGQVGAPPSLLAVEAAGRRGYDISQHRARLVTQEDIGRFEFSLAMDRSHLATMRWLAPRGLMNRPQMFMKFAPQVGVPEVPDPFGGPVEGYGQALDLIEYGCAGLLEHVKAMARTAT